MSIAQNMPGPVNSPHIDAGTSSPSTSSPAHAAPGDPALTTLKAAARDTQVTRAALAILTELYTSTNAWQTFTVKYLAAELGLSEATVGRALVALSGKSLKKGNRTIARRKYLDERPTHSAHGERQARLATTTPTKSR